jgi:hypothetical protein|tara:strand:- start:64 stop:384 length:321 start_codon:yes stop_codon:yes gene_type:complete
MKEPVKHDQDKPRIDLIPPQAIIDIAEVLTYGAEKYEAHNWRDNDGLAYSRLYAAAQRHMLAFWGGQTADEDSGFPHLAHAACCIIFLMSYEAENNGDDDRHPYTF